MNKINKNELNFVYWIFYEYEYLKLLIKKLTSCDALFNKN